MWDKVGGTLEAVKKSTPSPSFEKGGELKENPPLAPPLRKEGEQWRGAKTIKTNAKKRRK